MTQPTLLWHDYETWGVNPATDRPAQFAAIRTDLDLNIIGKPIEFYCQMPQDYLPHPEAVIITGITPQKANQKGMPEAKFMKKIHDLMMEPQTCVVGYNSLRFDDEVTRHGFYRNFFDPYAREYKSGNSRWDIIDLVRACYALRPEGIQWPTDEEGKPTFKLEALTQANHIQHAKAHDAVSDVMATIEMARCLRKAQPRLYDYYFKQRFKTEVSSLITYDPPQPLVHVSGMFGHERACTSMILPIAAHPTNKNAVIAIDLGLDATPLFDLDVEEIHERMYMTKEDRGALARIPLKLIHINKCPMLASAKLMTAEVAERAQFDLSAAQTTIEHIMSTPDLADKLLQVFNIKAPFKNATDPDCMLYSGGFFSPHDKSLMDKIRQTNPVNLADMNLDFHDPRLEEMFFLYRGRNYPNTLNEKEQQRWKIHCENKLHIEEFLLRIENLVYAYEQESSKIHLLRQLFEYVHH